MKSKYVKSSASYLKHYCCSVHGNTKIVTHLPIACVYVQALESWPALKLRSFPKGVSLGHSPQLRGIRNSLWLREEDKMWQMPPPWEAVGGHRSCLYDKSLAQTQPSAVAQHLLASVTIRGIRQYPKLQEFHLRSLLIGKGASCVAPTQGLDQRTMYPIHVRATQPPTSCDSFSVGLFLIYPYTDWSKQIDLSQ